MSGERRWTAAIAAASRLGIPPEAFWRLSVVEWRALTVPLGPPPLSRGDLDVLMRDHPDG